MYTIPLELTSYYLNKVNTFFIELYFIVMIDISTPVIVLIVSAGSNAMQFFYIIQMSPSCMCESVCLRVLVTCIGSM